jgi:predicted acetyltransferase
MSTVLVVPSMERLPQYVAALQQGWSPETSRAAAVPEQLARIEQDAAGFIARCTDLDAKGGAVKLPDGSTAKRIPGRQFWIWDTQDDAFCGVLGIRWQPGTAELPPHTLGHVGYNVVPWRRRQGHATAAVKAVLPYAHEVGLPYVEITCDPDNIASIKVIEGAGGVLHERFNKPEAFGSTPALRWRIAV